MFGDLLKMLYNMLKVEEMPSWRHPLVKAYFKVRSILRLKDLFTVKHCFLSPTSYVQSTVLFLPRTSLVLTSAKGLSWRGIHFTESQKMTQQREEQFWFSIFVSCSSHISQPTTKELTVENCTVVVHVFPPYYEKNPRKKWKNCPTQYGWAKSMDSVTLYVLWQ